MKQEDKQDDDARNQKPFVLPATPINPSSSKQIGHNALQPTILIGTAAATVLISFSKIIRGVVTGIVTVATAVVNYYNFGEHSQTLETIAENLALESNRFTNNRGVYANKPAEEA